LSTKSVELLRHHESALSDEEDSMNDITFGTRAQPLHAIEEALRVVREKADSVRFGTITLTIHEGRLTQLEVTEKRRFGS
jgi:hypothetical protein